MSVKRWLPRTVKLYDEKGVPMGSITTKGFSVTREMMDYTRKFLAGLNQEKLIPKEEEKDMATKTASDCVNIVYLSGSLKFNPSVYDNQTKALVDTGQKKPVPVMVSKNDKELRDRISRFREGDVIKLVCVIEPYGVKQDDGSWKNGLAIRVTEIKSETPKRDPIDGGSQSRSNGNGNRQQSSDIECPF